MNLIKTNKMIDFFEMMPTFHFQEKNTSSGSSSNFDDLKYLKNGSSF